MFQLRETGAPGKLGPLAVQSAGEYRSEEGTVMIHPLRMEESTVLVNGIKIETVTEVNNVQVSFKYSIEYYNITQQSRKVVTCIASSNTPYHLISMI